jgi:hypothetical protein
VSSIFPDDEKNVDKRVIPEQILEQFRSAISVKAHANPAAAGGTPNITPACRT